jgi:hypothetical protein
LLLAAALDLGRLSSSRVTVANAAREGAIETSIDPTRGLDKVRPID